MDILELIARSEWPIVVGGALLLFRRPIRKLIERINLTKIDAFGVKAEFEQGLTKVEALTSADEEEPKETIAAKETLKDQMQKMLLWYSPSHKGAVSPEALVLDTWSWLEGDMRAMIDAIHPRHSGVLHTPPLRFQAAAGELGLTEDEIESLVVLRELRNKLAHSAGISITWDDAIRFKEAADRLLRKMKKYWEEHLDPRRKEKK